MAFFPKDEYVPRRGVAMRTTEPDVRNLVGEHRDKKIAREVEIFVKADFVLNKALNKNPEQFSKVRTFNRAEGDHNVIQHAGVIDAIPPPRLRAELPEPVMRRLHHQHELADQERASAIDMMSHCNGLVQKLSSQKPTMPHKHHFTAPHVVKYPSDGIVGFGKLGAASDNHPEGKCRVEKYVYDPLKMKFPLQGEKGSPGQQPNERVQGLRCIPDPGGASTAQDHFQYHDGRPSELDRHRVVRHPHIHQFPDNFSQGAEIPGLHGLGKSDTSLAPVGKKYILANDNIYANFDAYSASPQKQQTRGSGPPSESYNPIHYPGSGNGASVAGSSSGGHLGQGGGVYASGGGGFGGGVGGRSPQQQYYSTPPLAGRAPHRVTPLKPDTLANKKSDYHASQGSIQFSPTPHRWVPGTDAGRTQFH